MYPIVLFAVIFAGSWLLFWTRSKRPKTDKNVLFVVAHPDDECMFFGPTLLNEIRWRAREKRSKVHLLVLSTGNFYGDGRLRKEELDSACHFLLKYCSKEMSNDDERVFVWEVIDHSGLPDSPNVQWSADLIGNLVNNYVKKHSIDKVITFDEQGISGHSNHIAIHLALSVRLDPSIQLWYLQSVALWRKYLSAFDLLFTCISSLYHNYWDVYFLTLFDYLYLVQTLRRHQSQMLWFRYLYSSTSRYMFINTLTPRPEKV